MQTTAALVPIFLVIALGWLLRARELFAESFWETAERLTFYILFPALLIVTIGGAEVGGADAAPLFAALFCTTGAVVMAAIGLRPTLRIDGATFSAVVQGMIRSNTYVALAAAYAIYGEAGLTLSAICILAVVPLANVVSVVVHLRWGDTQPAADPWRQALGQSVKNPIVIGCLVGAVLNLTGLGLPPLVDDALAIIGRAALPLGLLAAGAALRLKALRVSTGAVGAAVAVKLVVMPFLVTIACGIFGVSGVAVSVAILFGALPVSSSSYVMTRQMGGDGELMAAIVALSTLTGMCTMPLVIWALAP